MSTVWTVVRYKTKEGLDDEFLSAFFSYKPNTPVPLLNKYFLSFRLIRVSENEFVQIMECESMDKLVDFQIEALTWLDTVEHLLEYYGDERTEAFSGFTIEHLD